MKNGFDYSVSLRATHPLLPAFEISRGLDKVASYCWDAGEQRKTPKGALLGGTRRESYCSFDVGEGEDGNLAQCLNVELDEIEKCAPFLNGFRSTGGKLEFFCFWHSDGDTGEIFEPQLLARMAALEIALGINVLDLKEFVTS